jgi:hypothetical protein
MNITKIGKNIFQIIIGIHLLFIRWRVYSDYVTVNLWFSLHGLELEVVNSFTYLGIILSKTGNFNLAIADKGIKAMYEVLKLGRLHNLTIPCQLDYFDKMVKPALLYGCELWGNGNCDIIKRVHLKFCKFFTTHEIFYTLVHGLWRAGSLSFGDWYKNTHGFILGTIYVM